MNFIESHFWYNKSQRNGILILVLIIAFIQIGIYLTEEFFPQNESSYNEEKLEQWRAELDSLSKDKPTFKKQKIFPFNPNYLNDFKGYRLGLSVAEIDRLLAFRAQGKFVSSKEEFQNVTGVTDSLLNDISPFFNFPDFQKSSRNNDRFDTANKVNRAASNNQGDSGTNVSIEKNDLNQASENELRQIYGVGVKLARRITAYRKLLGSYSVNEQIYEVYHLPKETADRILDRFEVKEMPIRDKLNINEVTFKELLHLPYIDYELTKRIINYRNRNNGFIELSELKKIDSFPVDKFDRIALYLLAE